MGKRNGIEKQNGRRRKGLKNPTILWVLCFLLTFALTVLPAGLAGTLGSKKPDDLFCRGYWVKVTMDNLYPMIITQSAVTMLQNFSIAHLTKEERAVRQFVPCITWTYGLSLGLLFYITLYLTVVYAAPLWKNGFLSAISGVIAAIGLFSVLQLDREQGRIRSAKEKEKTPGGRFPHDDGGALGWPVPMPRPSDPPSGEDGERSRSSSGEPAFK